MEYNKKMAARPDGRLRLSEAAISRIARVERSRRRAWAEKGLLGKGGSGGYGELDACEAAVLRELAAELEFDLAREAWLAIRMELSGLLLAAPLFVVFDEARVEASLRSDLGSLGTAIARPGRYIVVEVTEAVADARTGFRNAVAAKSDPPRGVRGNVQELRQ